MASSALSGLAAVLLGAYPILAWVAMRQGVPARWLALGALALAAARWGRTLARKAPFLLAAAVAAAALLAWRWGEASVLFYPVAVNAAMLAVFAFSLRFPPTVIERLARLQHPGLDEAGVRYTRKVTAAWCAFFAANGLAALFTAVSGDADLWAFYNGFLAYALMGLMFAGEWLVRRRVRPPERA